MPRKPSELLDIHSKWLGSQAKRTIIVSSLIEKEAAIKLLLRLNLQVSKGIVISV